DAPHKKAEGEDAAGDGQGQPDAKALAGAPADGLDVVPFGGGPVGAVAPPADPAGAGLPLAGVVVGPAVLLLAGAAAGLPLLPAAVLPLPAFLPAALQVHRLLEGVGHLLHHAVQHGGDVAGHIV